jgi:ATP-dependent helicase HepA
MLHIGDFAELGGNSHGIGKVSQIHDSKVEITYFDSIARPEVLVLLANRSEVIPSSLSIQTRCYWEDEGRWRIGRVIEKHADPSKYVVRTSNKVDWILEGASLHVRWGHSISDPLEIMIVGGMESPYYSDCRRPFVRSIVQQRASSRGITSLLGAGIELYKHQVEVIRRVLQDPIQRYLLADEVGLGKTIEAGIVVRQFLLENPRGRVVIVTPSHLKDQWETEMQKKLFTDDFIFANIEYTSDFSYIKGFTPNEAGLLIVDEVHHFAAGYRDGDHSSRNRFERLRVLAHSSARVLLLSATPIIGNEENYLAMLHLLEPSVYSLDGVEGFKDKVETRQQLGMILYTLKEGTQDFLVRSKAEELRGLFPDDTRLSEYTRELEKALEKKSGRDVVDEKIRSIRVHISETYRLNRRMLRTRRDANLYASFPVRGRKRPRILHCESALLKEIQEWMDTWRDLVFGERCKSAEQVSECAEVFRILVERSGSLPSAFGATCRYRLRPNEADAETAGLDASEQLTLMKCAVSDAEREMLGSIVESIGSSDEPDNRIITLEEFLWSLDHQKRVVIFSSFTDVARQVYDNLCRRFGPSSAVLHVRGLNQDELEKGIHRFTGEGICRFFVSDQVGEEGLNLQHADLLVHFDLPWHPNRVEQRIGRLDRFGKGGPVESVLLLGGNPELSYSDNWVECLDSGFGVFHESIASLQFVVERQRRSLIESVFASGLEQLGDTIDALDEEISSERRKVQEQDILDSIEAVDETQDFFEDLKQVDASWEAIRNACEGLICGPRGGLRFYRLATAGNRKILKYQLSPPGRENEPWCMPLIPHDRLQSEFCEILSRKGSYDRKVASDNPGTRIFRVGDPFIDALVKYVMWDDRGKTSAMGRIYPPEFVQEDFLGLRFDYVVEPDISYAAEWMATSQIPIYEASALQRRVDFFSPPYFETIWLDENLVPIESVELRTLLERPYDKDKGDVNLGGEKIGIVEEFIGRDQWIAFLRRARKISQELLKKQAQFKQKTKEAGESSARSFSARLEQLRFRQARIGEKATSPSSPNEFEVESRLSELLLRGIHNPSITLDSMSVVLLSQSPFDVERLNDVRR